MIISTLCLHMYFGFSFMTILFLYCTIRAHSNGEYVLDGMVGSTEGEWNDERMKCLVAEY